MRKDKLFTQIVKGLSGKLDTELFERCVTELLRPDYPGLSHVAGGSDRGTDGAIESESGPISLIATTRADPEVNLRTSLSSRQEQPVGPPTAVFVTSQKLTPQARDKLLAIAKDEFGVTLRNIHDQTDIAYRLRQSPLWRKELLGIPASMALDAVSPTPLGSRRGEGFGIFGREEDLAWLRANQTADAIVVGQPGVGKTYLHEVLANEGVCRFCISDDASEIGDALLEEQVPLLVIDDAHTRLKLVRELVHFRKTVERPFALHFNCWPGYEDSVAAAAQLPSPLKREVEALHPNSVVQLAKHLGLAGPDGILHLVVEQSLGRPGLAAWLVRGVLAANSGMVIWNGDLLSAYLASHLSKEERSLLAVLSVGGEAGLELEQLAAAVQKSEHECQLLLTNLAAGGIIETFRPSVDTPRRMRVQPKVLRAVLVRDHYFGQLPIDLPFELISQLSAESVLLVLCEARQRDANVSSHLLWELAEKADSSKGWEAIGSTDAELSEMVLRQRPRAIRYAFDGCLHLCGESSLGTLLGLALKEDPGAWNPPPVFYRDIDKWASPRDAGLAIARRSALLTQLRAIKSLPIEAAQVYGSLVSLCIQIGQQDVSLLPGDGRTVGWSHWAYPLSEIEGFAKLWPAALAALEGREAAFWNPLSTVLHGWAWPLQELRSVQDGEKYKAKMQALCTPMLVEYVQKHPCPRAAALWGAELAEGAHLDARIAADADFEAIYAARNFAADVEAESLRREALARDFVRRLRLSMPREVSQYLARIVDEARLAGFQNHGSQLRLVGEILAQETHDDRKLFEALLDHIALDQVVEGWLWQSLKVGQSQLSARIAMMLNHVPWHRLAVHMGLALDADADSVAGRIVEIAVTDDSVVPQFLHLATPLATMKRLLNSDSQRILSVAIQSVWRGSEASIPAELVGHWRAAVMKWSGEDRGERLGYILGEVPDLAYHWLKSRVEDAKQLPSAFSDVFRHAGPRLHLGQKRELLRALPRDYYAGIDIEEVVGADDVLLSDWIERHKSNAEEAIYLVRDLQPQRLDVAIELALSHGIGVEDLANAVMRMWLSSWSGSPAEHLDRKRSHLLAMRDSSSAGLQLLAAKLLPRLEQRLALERRREKTGLMYGRQN